MAPSNDTTRIYNLSLFGAFVANVFQLISVSLLFRYADFVTKIGGDEWHLGWIVGISAVGAVSFRIIQGAAIDRIGAEWIWYLCLVGQLAGLTWHLQIESVNSLSVYCARILYASSVAGTFGSWLSFVSLQAPKGRVAEVIGVIGASGFVGMATGPAIGDYLFSSGETFDSHVDQMFYCSIASVTLAFVFAVLACRTAIAQTDAFDDAANKNAAQSAGGGNPFKIIADAKPRFVLVLGALMGMTIGFPGTYLRPFAASLDINQINVFFVVYNITAFISRLIFRKTPQQLGLKPTICLGFGLMISSMLLFLTVKNEARLFWPAIAGGLAHSFLFPSVITLCTEHFSSTNRGIATNLILAMYDVGTLVGMPMVGAILTQSRSLGIAPYGTAFVAIAAIIFAVMLVYITTGIGKASRRTP